MAAVPGWMAAVPVLVAWNLAALWSSAHFCINAQAFPVGFGHRDFYYGAPSMISETSLRNYEMSLQ